MSFRTFWPYLAIDACLAVLAFRHAYLRRNRHAIAWGVFTFLAAGIAIPTYLIYYWVARRAHR